MQGTVYNDKEDQALEISRLVVDIYQGNSMKNHNLQQGKYYVSQYKKLKKQYRQIHKIKAGQYMWSERFNKEFKEESKKETNEKSKNELKKNFLETSFMKKWNQRKD